MLQPRAARLIIQSISLLVSLCAGTPAPAQDDLISRGIDTFRETCLMADVRSEKIYQWAADKDLKIVKSAGLERRGGIKELTWEVARSEAATVLLQMIMTGPLHLNCSVYFDQQRDPNKLVETFFLEEMKRHHAGARQLRPRSDADATAHSFMDGRDLYGYLDGRQNEQDKPHILLALFANLPPSDVAVPRTFATPERSYRFFANTCLARFPDIEGIGEYVAQKLGWKSPAALQTSPFYSGSWSLWDPFDEMAPYLIGLIHSNAFKLCEFHYDLRAAVPMEQLIHDYALVHADAPPGFPPRPGEKFEYYTGRVGGMQAMFKLRTEEAIHSAELSVYVESPQ